MDAGMRRTDGGQKKKEEWACGGCLGVECRRRTWAAAKSIGELEPSRDPMISEWGNPPSGKGWHPVLNQIGTEEGTARTETSQ